MWILQVIKDWRWECPGNKASGSTLSAVVSFKVTRKLHSPPTLSLVSVEIEATCVLARHLGGYFTPLLGGMLCRLVTLLGGVVYQVHSLHRSLITTVSCPDPNSHEEKDLVAIEWFLGCAEPAVLIFNEPMDLPGICVNGHATNGLFKSILQLGTTNKWLDSHQTLFSCEDGVCVPFRLLLKPHRSEVNFTLLFYQPLEVLSLCSCEQLMFT